MKKNALLLTFVLVVILSACTNQTEPNEELLGGTKESTATIEDKKTEQVAEEDEADAPKADIVKVVEEYKKGTINDTGYESQWIGIRFTKPSETSMLSEKTLNEEMSISEELLAGNPEELQKAYDEMQSVIEMMCYVSTGSPSIIITADKVADEVTADQYLKSFEDTLKKIEATSYTILEDTAVTMIGDKEFHVLKTKGEQEGQELLQDFYIMVKGDRAIKVTLTYTEDVKDVADSMIQAFRAY